MKPVETSLSSMETAQRSPPHSGNQSNARWQEEKLPWLLSLPSIRTGERPQDGDPQNILQTSKPSFEDPKFSDLGGRQ